MQIFELVVVSIATLYLLFNRSINKRLNVSYIAGGLVSVLLLQLIIEGARWQMVPAYLIWVIAMISAVNQSNEKASTSARIFKSLGLIALFALAILLPSILPVFELPKPAGPYTVGTSDIYMKLDRDEPITNDADDSREIMVKAWFPSSQSGKVKDSYIDNGGRIGFAQKYGLPPFILNYLDQIETHVYSDIAIADEAFPVLIFSHGYNSKANGYYALLSEIVSQGYVVFAVNHTYESTGTTFPDNRVELFDYDYAHDIESNTWEIITPVIEAFDEGLTFDERHPIVKEALTTYFGRDIVERWAQDLGDVVNELEKWNSEGPFRGRLDLSKIGAFGHSRGGGAAGELTLTDNRIRAGANLDGVQWGQIVTTAFQKPFLFLSSDWPESHENLIPHAYINKSTSVFYDGLLLQSGHSNFMDIPYMIPVQALSMAGEIDPDLAMEITTKLVTSFFDRHLNGSNTKPLSISSEYELLELNIHKGDSLR